MDGAQEEEGVTERGTGVENEKDASHSVPSGVFKHETMWTSTAASARRRADSRGRLSSARAPV
jgi:hypothetical protein